LRTVRDFYSLSDKGIEAELGRRLKSLRLRKNITQKELAEATTLSLNTIKSLEAGRGKLASLIAVLRELGAMDHLDHVHSPPLSQPHSISQTARQGAPARQR